MLRHRTELLLIVVFIAARGALGQEEPIVDDTEILAAHGQATAAEVAFLALLDSAEADSDSIMAAWDLMVQRYTQFRDIIDQHRAAGRAYTTETFDPMYAYAPVAIANVAVMRLGPLAEALDPGDYADFLAVAQDAYAQFQEEYVAREQQGIPHPPRIDAGTYDGAVTWRAEFLWREARARESIGQDETALDVWRAIHDHTKATIDSIIADGLDADGFYSDRISNLTAMYLESVLETRGPEAYARAATKAVQWLERDGSIKTVPKSLGNHRPYTEMRGRAMQLARSLDPAEREAALVIANIVREAHLGRFEGRWLTSFDYVGATIAAIYVHLARRDLEAAQVLVVELEGMQLGTASRRMLDACRKQLDAKLAEMPGFDADAVLDELQRIAAVPAEPGASTSDDPSRITAAQGTMSPPPGGSPGTAAPAPAPMPATGSALRPWLIAVVIAAAAVLAVVVWLLTRGSG